MTAHQPVPVDVGQRLRVHLVRSGAFLERLRVVAQLAAAGTGYRRMARYLSTSPEDVHAMAEAGARLLLREGSAPEELRDALAALPPLEPPPVRKPRPRRPRTPRAVLDDLSPLPLDLDALTAAPELDDFAVPLEDLEAFAADPPVLDPDEP
ncbi:hypothetical protein ABZT02_44975 [Streptomyces sp. NPDC005402]|uniref:hypothetical protein n=1 Tax=Streptomyces sp. NPDC005402 TaxID=3155338 RepID=UPI0033B4185B